MTEEVVDLFELLKDATVPPNPIFDKYTIATTSYFAWRDMLENPNGWILYMAAGKAAELDPDRSIYHDGFVNMLNLLSYSFEVSPYYNSRIGWLLWMLMSYVDKGSYYPMRYCSHYDPIKWYMPHEKPRPLEIIDPDDVFGIGKPQAKGHDAFRMRL